MATSDRHRRPAVGVDHPTVVPTNLDETESDGDTGTDPETDTE